MRRVFDGGVGLDNWGRLLISKDRDGRAECDEREVALRAGEAAILLCCMEYELMFWAEGRIKETKGRLPPDKRELSRTKGEF